MLDVQSESLSSHGRQRREAIGELALQAAGRRRLMRRVRKTGAALVVVLVGAMAVTMFTRSSDVAPPPQVAQIEAPPIELPVEPAAPSEPKLRYVEVVTPSAPRHASLITSTRTKRHVAFVDDAGLIEELEKNNIAGGLAWIDGQPRFVSPSN